MKIRFVIMSSLLAIASLISTPQARAEPLDPIEQLDVWIANLEVRPDPDPQPLCCNPSTYYTPRAPAPNDPNQAGTGACHLEYVEETEFLNFALTMMVEMSCSSGECSPGFYDCECVRSKAETFTDPSNDKNWQDYLDCLESET